MDFLPFYPMVPYDSDFGGRTLNRATGTTMFVLWLLVSTFTWATAIRISKHARRVGV